MNDFAGTDDAVCFVAEVEIGKRLERNAVSVLFFSDNKRRAAVFIAGNNDFVFCQNQDGEGTADAFLDISDTVFECVAAVNHDGCQFRRIDFSAREFDEVGRPFLKNQFNQFFDIVQFSDGGDCIFTQMGMDVKGL